MKQTIKISQGEKWWGGASNLGTEMPFKPGALHDLRGDNLGNQAAPLLLSSAGRYVWSAEPFRFRIGGDALRIEGAGPFVVEAVGGGLRDAYRDASRRFFPPQGRAPHPLLFKAPQYNTWIELMYDQAQEPILRYARNLLRQGYPPGVLMIDEGWANYYGDWDFNATRFPRPRQLIDELHRLGFKVMLWIVPFVVPDSRVFRELRAGRVLVKDKAGKPVVREWWNGYSALVDVTGGDGRRWFLAQLKRLRRDYGVDGFKFDAGDTPYYRDDDVLAVPANANGHTEAFGRLGTGWRLNEYRACWKCAGEPLAQRLRDKLHTWDSLGMRSLIPNTLALGLIGHAFVCPDMIGGGDYSSFVGRNVRLDPELFVRYAQASALMPMMQFSAAPWRVLDRRHAGLCLEAARLHLRFAGKIWALAKESARTGEPMVRSLAYQYPGLGYETITDQFLLGGDILVAPVVEKKLRARKVVIPPGTWRADDDSEVVGPAEVEVAAPLERLPYFVSIKK